MERNAQCCMEGVQFRVHNLGFGDGLVVDQVAQVLHNADVRGEMGIERVTDIEYAAQQDSRSRQGVFTLVLLDFLAGVDFLLVFRLARKLESQVKAEPYEESFVVGREQDHDRDFEEHLLDGGLVFAVAGFGFEVEHAVVKVQFGVKRQGARKERHLGENARAAFVAELPVAGLFTENHVHATCGTESEGDFPGKALLAGAVLFRVFLQVAVVGIVVFFLAFGQQGVGRGAVLVIAGIGLGHLRGISGRGRAISGGCGCLLAVGFLRGTCGGGLRTVAPVANAGGVWLVVAAVQFRAASVLGGNPCGIGICLVTILGEGAGCRNGHNGQEINNSGTFHISNYNKSNPEKDGKTAENPFFPGYDYRKGGEIGVCLLFSYIFVLIGSLRTRLLYYMERGGL